jgi:glyoxylase-like metal-dependent hydrolase (beta-lactamase superfamily II)
MKSVHVFLVILSFAAALAIGGFARPPKEVRLYVLDCGGATAKDPAVFGLSKKEVHTLEIADPCYLVVHGKRTVLFDTGWNEAGPKGPIAELFSAHVNKSLKAQLAEIGYTPDEIDYLILSHWHSDHSGNANDYAGSRWLVQKAERDFMFSPEAMKDATAQYYAKLQESKTEILEGDHDIFGDGTVVIKATPGHTPGSQSLFVKLAHSGPVLLSGDLWQFPEQRALDRVPGFEFNKDQTRASRAAIEQFLKETRAQVWIGHDAAGFATRKKAPDYYD